MRHKLLVLLSLFVLLPIYAEAQDAPQHRVVYLWDVTYSMHGGRMGGKTDTVLLVGGEKHEIVQYNPNRDIYDATINQLIEDIYRPSITAMTEIVIVPFNNHVLEKKIMRARGTSEGKKELEKKIRSFCELDQTYTNLYDPFQYAKDKILPAAVKKSSIVKVLTDGNHNVSHPSEQDFYNLLRNWCEFAEPLKIQGYYFLLKEQIKPELKKILDESPCWEYNDNFIIRNSFEIESKSCFNLKEDFNKPIPLYVKPEIVNDSLVGNMEISITMDENPYMSVDTTIVIQESDKNISIIPHYKHSLQELQEKMPNQGYTSLMLRLEQVDNKCPNELSTKFLELQYVNKKQIIMTIEIEKKL